MPQIITHNHTSSCQTTPQNINTSQTNVVLFDRNALYDSQLHVCVYQVGFGWTNGVILDILKRLPNITVRYQDTQNSPAFTPHLSATLLITATIFKYSIWNDQSLLHAIYTVVQPWTIIQRVQTVLTVYTVQPTTVEKRDAWLGRSVGNGAKSYTSRLNIVLLMSWIVLPSLLFGSVTIIREVPHTSFQPVFVRFASDETRVDIGTHEILYMFSGQVVDIWFRIDHCLTYTVTYMRRNTDL